MHAAPYRQLAFTCAVVVPGTLVGASPDARFSPSEDDDEYTLRRGLDMKDAVRRTEQLLLSCILLCTACNGTDGDVGATATDSAGSTSEGTTTSGVGLDTSGITAASTSLDASSTTDEPAASSSSGAENETGSTGSSSSSESDTAACRPGELGCACDEDSCLDGLECVEDICAELQECIDDDFGENLDEDTAFNLGEISDDDDDGGTVMGVLTGPDDVDWFRYDGSDEPLSMIDPFRTIVSSAPVRFCKYAECADGDEIDFPCQENAVATTSPGGRPGCCADSLIHVPDAVCGSSGINDDSMIVWVRVDQAEDACVTYAFDYHF